MITGGGIVARVTRGILQTAVAAPPVTYGGAYPLPPGFAETATYTPLGGVGISVSVVLEDLEVDTDASMDGRYLEYRARLYAYGEEITDPARGDTVTVNATLWTVLEVEHVRPIVTLYLGRSVPLEKGPARGPVRIER